MVSRKYASDYRLENIEGKNGKIVTKPVYRGDLFGFLKPTEEIKRLKTIFIAVKKTIDAPSADYAVYFV